MVAATMLASGTSLARPLRQASFELRTVPKPIEETGSALSDSAPVSGLVHFCYAVNVWNRASSSLLERKQSQTHAPPLA